MSWPFSFFLLLSFTGSVLRCLSGYVYLSACLRLFVFCLCLCSIYHWLFVWLSLSFSGCLSMPYPKYMSPCLSLFVGLSFFICWSVFLYLFVCLSLSLSVSLSMSFPKNYVSLSFFVCFSVSLCIFVFHCLYLYLSFLSHLLCLASWSVAFPFALSLSKYLVHINLYPMSDSQILSLSYKSPSCSLSLSN